MANKKAQGRKKKINKKKHISVGRRKKRGENLYERFGEYGHMLLAELNVIILSEYVHNYISSYDNASDSCKGPSNVVNQPVSTEMKSPSRWKKQLSNATTIESLRYTLQLFIGGCSRIRYTLQLFISGCSRIRYTCSSSSVVAAG